MLGVRAGHKGHVKIRKSPTASVPIPGRKRQNPGRAMGRFFVWAQPRAEEEGECMSSFPTGILAPINSLCLEPRFPQEHSSHTPSSFYQWTSPLFLPALNPPSLSPALPAQPALSTQRLLPHEFPHPKARSVETFSRLLGKRNKKGGDRKWGRVVEKKQVIPASNFFSLFFIMTHVYNTKYLDQEQGCQDTKSTFIAGHKDK
jgi:hypothetical protein